MEPDNCSNNINNTPPTYNELLKENNSLKESIKIMKEKQLNEQVDNFVDEWFDKYNDEVDIGKIAMFNVFGKEYEIDILPDNMEKAIYKKCIKIMITLLSAKLSV